MSYADQDPAYTTYAQPQTDQYNSVEAIQYDAPQYDNGVGVGAVNQPNPYNTTVLETVQNATIGSKAVKYNTPTPEAIQPETIELDMEESVSQESESQESESQELCRDFLHGLCGRVDCKFRHDSAARDSERAKLPVCKDYQKSKCHRGKCKYLHLTEAEEEEFEKTGVMPEKKNDDKQDDVGVEQCRDFMNGLCKRGDSCKYSHSIKAEIGDGSLSLYGKRPYSASSLSIGNINMPNGNLTEENEELKQRLLDLRKQVLELTQLNDALYSENIKFRKQLTGNNMMGEKMSLLPRPLSKNGIGH